LAKYPESGISGAVICGTGWMSPAVLQAGKFACELVCKRKGEWVRDEKLNALVFSGYNSKVEHPRTSHDWLSRDNRSVDAYVADPLCGFVPTAGLLRDMLTGILHIQNQQTLNAMDRKLPVFFIAGGDDPVGGYGKGVRKAAQMFRSAGMEAVDERIYPLCRHEILNELNREEIWEDVAQWIEKKAL
jgi:alpha-beta hydrolase superfamily lysophospholipase